MNIVRGEMGFLIESTAVANCFMCLKSIIITISTSSTSAAAAPCSKSNPPSRTTTTTSILQLKLLSRYLKVDFEKVLDDELLLTLPPDAAQVMGPPPPPPLCDECGKLTGEFWGLHHQLELIRLRAEDCVRKIHGVMEEAEQKELLQQYRRKYSLAREAESGRRISRFSEILRKELLAKGSTFLSKRSPRVRLHVQLADDFRKLQKQGTTGNIDNDISISSTPPPQYPPDEGLLDDDTSDENESALAIIPPPPPSPPSSSTPEEIRVPFKKLGGGDSWECGLCFKVVRGDSRYNHKLSHGSAEPFRCVACTKTFRYAAALSQHKIAEHSASFFSKYQEPSVSPAQFEKIIVELLDGLDVPQQGRRSHSCPYCASVQQSRELVRRHVIRHHKDKLVPRLMVLQKGLLLGLGEEEQKNVGVVGGTTVSVSKGFETLSPSSSSSSSSSSQKNISFRRCGGGKYQCGTCSKVLANRASFQSHSRICHLSAPIRRYRCDLCPKSFNHLRSVWDHKSKEHVSTFFAAYKDSKLASVQFESLVEKLFERRVDVPQRGSYSCTFCLSVQLSKSRIRTHVLRKHKDELVKELLGRQTRRIRDDDDDDDDMEAGSFKDAASDAVGGSHHHNRQTRYPSGGLPVASAFQPGSSSGVDAAAASLEISIEEESVLIVKTEEEEEQEDGLASRLSQNSREESLVKDEGLLLDDASDDENGSALAIMPPPPPPPSASTPDEELRIPFRKLGVDSWECGVCFKVLRGLSIPTHRMSHGGRKPFSCSDCSKTFRYSTNLSDHKYADHRSTFFSKYKTPNVTPEQFEKVITDLYYELEVPVLVPQLGRRRSFSCTYCANVQRSPSRVRNHVFRHHRERLVPRLMDLQKGVAVVGFGPGGGEDGTTTEQGAATPNKFENSDDNVVMGGTSVGSSEVDSGLVSACATTDSTSNDEDMLLSFPEESEPTSSVQVPTKEEEGDQDEGGMEEDNNINNDDSMILGI